MTMHLSPFLLLLVLVLAPLPTLQGSRRTLQAVSPAPAPLPYWSLWPAPGSSAAPGPQPIPAPVPPVVPPPKLPPSGGGGGGGGGAVPQQDGGGSSTGLSGGQKAGIIFGVLAAAGLIGFGTVVFMKRQSNIRRSRFGLLARRSQL